LAQVGAQRLPNIGGQRRATPLPRKTIRPPRRLDRSQAQACERHKDRIVADTRGIADVAAAEQPLHAVGCVRLRDTGVATPERRDIPRSRRRAPCFWTSRRRLRTPLRPETNDERSAEANGRTPSRRSKHQA
jgi:hypothetical protein